MSSWGSTAFTPIISYNTPPWGFEERPNPPDFSVCPEDPYAATENLKNEIKHLTKIANNGDGDYGNLTKEFFSYNLDETKTNNIIFIILIVLAIYFIYKLI